MGFGVAAQRADGVRSVGRQTNERWNQESPDCFPATGAMNGQSCAHFLNSEFGLLISGSLVVSVHSAKVAGAKLGEAATLFGGEGKDGEATGQAVQTLEEVSGDLAAELVTSQLVVTAGSEAG